MQRSFAFLAALVQLCSISLLAQGTRTWNQNSFDDFEKGTSRGVAISSRGAIELAPAFKAIITTPSTYIWSIVADDAGNLYAATGSPARVYKITPDGHASVLFEPKELQVQSVVVGKDAIYAATSPDGKIYRIEQAATGKKGSAAAKPQSDDAAAQDKTSAAQAASDAKAAEATVDPTYSASIYFDPRTKYIWDLAFDREGRLYAATGDQGQIFRITRAGEGSVFFKSDEAHIRVLMFDAKGDLIAGSDGSGLIYRIAPSGEAFVLYSAPKKEVTALAMDEAGNMYAAATGEKRAAQPTAAMAAPASSGSAPPLAAGSISPLVAGANTGGSEIYQIAPDGSPRKLWSSREDIVYALAFYGPKRLLAATGNKGRIYALDVASTGDYADLLKASASQVTSFAKAPSGALFGSTSNLGKIFRIGPGPETEGSYDSDVFDARIFSQWGRAEVRGQGNYELWARSGNVDNPDRNWSPWKRVLFTPPGNGALEIPSARFVQWRVVLRPVTSGASTAIDSVKLNYLGKNVAPEIDDVTVQPGIRYQSGSGNMSGVPAPPGNNPPVSTRDKDSIGVRWSASDENDDTLTYSLFYRGDGETNWKQLSKNPVSERSYSFDAALLPDGGYTVKIVASDSPAHAPGEALTDERESSRFEVDNTPPQVEGLSAVVVTDAPKPDDKNKRTKKGKEVADSEGPRVHVMFRAVDSFSAIKRAEVSMDAGEWQLVEPVGMISDNKTESYDFNIPLPANAVGEHVIVVRAYDHFDNQGSAKVLVK